MLSQLSLLLLIHQVIPLPFNTCMPVQKNVCNFINFFYQILVCYIDEEPEPFYVAEVIANNFHTNILTVRWYTPTSLSKKRCKDAYHNMFYELELEKIEQRGRQAGPARYRLDPIVQDITYDQCFFGFSKLRDETGALHQEVQRQLRSHSLIAQTEKIKRKWKLFCELMHTKIMKTSHRYFKQRSNLYIAHE